MERPPSQGEARKLNQPGGYLLCIGEHHIITLEIGEDVLGAHAMIFRVVTLVRSGSKQK